MGYGGLPCGHRYRPLRLDKEVAGHRLKTARPLYPIVLRTKRFASIVAQEAVHRTRLVVQGIYPDMRYVAPLGNKQTAKLHNEVAEIRKATVGVAFLILKPKVSSRTYRWFSRDSARLCAT